MEICPKAEKKTHVLNRLSMFLSLNPLDFQDSSNSVVSPFSNWNAFHLLPGILLETVRIFGSACIHFSSFASDFNFFTSFVKGFHAHSGPSLCFLSHNTSDIKRVKHMENVQNLYAFCFFYPPATHNLLPCIKCLSNLIHGILSSIALNHNLFKGIKSDVSSEEMTSEKIKRLDQQQSS